MTPALIELGFSYALVRGVDGFCMNRGCSQTIRVYRPSAGHKRRRRLALWRMRCALSLVLAALFFAGVHLGIAGTKGARPCDRDIGHKCLYGHLHASVSDFTEIQRPVRFCSIKVCICESPARGFGDKFVWKRPDIDFGWMFWMFAGSPLPRMHTMTKRQGKSPLAASAQPSSRAESAMVGLPGRNKLKAISGMPHSVA